MTNKRKSLYRKTESFINNRGSQMKNSGWQNESLRHAEAKRFGRASPSNNDVPVYKPDPYVTRRAAQFKEIEKKATNFPEDSREIIMDVLYRNSEFVDDIIAVTPEERREKNPSLGYSAGLTGTRIIFRATRNEGTRMHLAALSQYIDVDVCDVYYGDLWVCGDLKDGKTLLGNKRVAIVLKPE